MCWRPYPHAVFGKKEHTVGNIRKRLDAFCDKMKADGPVRSFDVAAIEVCEGYPANTIPEKAGAFDCDGIVMRTHGKGRTTPAFLESVAKKVLRRSRRPVFTIPLPEEDTELSFKN